MTVLSKLQEKIQSVRGERELNFGNEIIEILVLPACPKWKPIVAMALPKMGGKKKFVATKLPKMEGKKNATSTIFFTTNYK